MISQTSSNQTSEEEALIKDAFVAFGGDKELQDVIDLSKMTSIIENDFKLEVNVKVSDLSLSPPYPAIRNSWRLKM